MIRYVIVSPSIGALWGTCKGAHLPGILGDGRKGGSKNGVFLKRGTATCATYSMD